MKKFIIILLFLVVLISVCGCVSCAIHSVLNTSLKYTFICESLFMAKLMVNR